MILTMLLINAALVCVPPKLINDTNEWNDTDKQSFERAKIRCGELYKYSPCLKVFRKREENLYVAICGSNEDTNGWNDRVMEIK